MSCGQGMWRGWVVAAEAGQELVEVGAGELPVEWPGSGVVVLLEGEDLGGEGLRVLEVVGGEKFALYDGEVDLDLVQPGGVDWKVHHLRVGIGVPKTVGGGPVAVRGPVVHDPEHPPRRGVRLGAHHLVHQRGERLYPGGGLAPAEDAGAV